MTPIEAKFAREAKAHPTRWIITPSGRGTFTIVRIAPDLRPRPQLRLVT